MAKDRRKDAIRTKLQRLEDYITKTKRDREGLDLVDTDSELSLCDLRGSYHDEPHFYSTFKLKEHVKGTYWSPEIYLSGHI